jgi:hypothetical protein
VRALQNESRAGRAGAFRRGAPKWLRRLGQIYRGSGDSTGAIDLLGRSVTVLGELTGTAVPSDRRREPPSRRKPGGRSDGSSRRPR